MNFVEGIVIKPKIFSEYTRFCEFMDFSFDRDLFSELFERRVFGGGAKGSSDEGAKKTSVLVVHGRNTNTRDAMFQFLRSLGLRPIEWLDAIRQTGRTSPTISEILDAAFRSAQVVVVVMTGDDEARLKKKFAKKDDPEKETILRPQPRPNVFFEAGMALGRTPLRTILVRVGEIRPFSDISGMHVVQLSGSGSSEERQELVSLLKSAGANVDSEGLDWLSAGDFRTD